MDKNYLIQLTNNLYRLTLLFPKKEPLRYKMRELADDILAKCLNNQHPALVDDLEVLDGFFEVAKNQNWVKPIELLHLQEEYNRIKAEIKKISKKSPEEKTTEGRPLQVLEIAKQQSSEKTADVNDLTKKVTEGRPLRIIVNSRQEKILEFLRENGRAQVWQLKEIFPEVAKRTLRRDFESLLKQGIIERIGERNATFYQLKTGKI